MANEKELIKLVLARLNAMPDNVQIHLGDVNKPLDKDDLIKHVKSQDDLGKFFVNLQYEYIKASIKGF